MYRNLVHQRKKQMKFCRSMWYRFHHKTIDSILQSIDEISKIPIPKFWPFTSRDRVNLLFQAAQRLIEFDSKIHSQCYCISYCLCCAGYWYVA